MKTLLLIFLIPACALAQSDTLTLREAWSLALQNSPTDEAAQARLRQVEARYQQTRSLLQPRLTLEASGRRLEYSSITQSRIPNAPDAVDEFEAGLNASWLLWNNGGRKNRILAARNTRDAGEAGVSSTRETLLAEVARAFTAAQLARENLRIATEDQAFQEEQLADSLKKEEAGVSSRADRLNFEIRKLAAENAAVRQSAEMESAMAALKALLGLPVDSDLPRPGEFTTMAEPAPAPESARIWKNVVEQRPELIEAALRVQAAEATLQSQKSEYGPSVSAFGGFTANREEDPNFEDGDIGNVIGVQLNWDLWEGSARKERILEAEAAVDEAKALQRQLRLQARAELQQALANYRAGILSEKITETTLERSRENRELVKSSYEAGRETLLRLNEAQRDYNTAEARYAAARLQRRLAWINIQRAVGSLRDNVTSYGTIADDSAED